MKWILLLSLVVNGVLGFQLLQKKEVVREEIVEKVVIKEVAPKIVEKKVSVEEPKKEVSAEPPKMVEYDETDFNDVYEEMNEEREDFLRGQLGLSEKDFQAIENVKTKYYKKFNEVIPPDYRGVITTDHRKKLIQLEEERDAEFARVIGTKKWESFTRFRDEYNRKMYQKGIKEKGVIVPMEI